MSDWLTEIAKEVVRDLIVSAVKSGTRKLWVRMSASPGTPLPAPVRPQRFDPALWNADAFLRAAARHDYVRARELCYLRFSEEALDESVARLFGVEPPLSWTFVLIHYSAENAPDEGPECVGIEGEVTFPLSAAEAEHVPTLFWMVRDTGQPWSVYEIEWYFSPDASR